MRYFLTLDLNNDPEMIRQYEYWHRPENIWKEIPEGIRKVGIHEMEIYRWKNRLIMELELDDDYELQEVLNQLKYLARQSEWESFMDQFQKPLSQKKEEGKWQTMKKIFSLSDCK